MLKRRVTCKNASRTASTALAVLVSLIVMAGCTIGDGFGPDVSAPDDVGSTVPVSPASLEPREVISASHTLSCDQQIATTPPEKDLTIVNDVVALPVVGKADPLQAARIDAENSQLNFYAKRGLLVRSAAPFDLVVPESERDRLALSWGNAGTLTWRLHVDCHGSQADWLVFAGGYYLSRPDCISLIVRAADRQKMVRIGAGASC